MGVPGDGFTSFRRRPSVWDVEFDFDTNAAASPAGVVGRGIKSVVRTGVGIFLATLTDSFVGLVGCSPELTAPTNDGRWAAIGPVTNAAGVITVQIFTYAANGTPTDFAANAASRVYVALAFTDSVQKP